MKTDWSEAIKWTSCAVAVIFVAYITKNPLCLWAFLIPACC